MSSVVIAGNTSGSVTLSAPDVAGTTTLTLPSTSGNVLTSASSIATSQLSGSISASSLPTGSVLQVVQTSYSTYQTRTSSTYADTGLTASITPSSSSNKVLVIVNITGVGKGGANTSAAFKLLRNSTELFLIETMMGYTNNTSTNYSGGTGGTYLDSPSSTSSTTYKVQWANLLNAGTVYMCDYPIGTPPSSTITLMEIKG